MNLTTMLNLQGLYLNPDKDYTAVPLVINAIQFGFAQSLYTLHSKIII